MNEMGTLTCHDAVLGCACLHSRDIPRAQCHSPEYARDQWEPPQKTCIWWVWWAASCLASAELLVAGSF